MGNKNLCIFILVATIVAQATWVRAANDDENLPPGAHIGLRSAGPTHCNRDWVVGDCQGWTTGVDYNAWLCGKDIRAGDTLVFNYERGKHNVLIVNECQANDCAVRPPGPGDPAGCGRNRITVLDAGTHCFISGIGDDCKNGMKLLVPVKW